MARSIRFLFFLLLLIFNGIQVTCAQFNADNEVIAVFPKNFPPEYQLSPEGKPFGYAIEVMDEVARRAGVNIKYLPVENWSLVWEKLSNGEADVVPNMGITAKREGLVSFTQPYDHFEITIFINKETRNIKGLSDLAGKKVSSTVTNVAKDLVKDLNLIYHLNAEQSLQALINKEVDAVILPKALMMQLASKMSRADQIVAVGKPLKVLSRAIAVNKNNPTLFKLINSTMNDYLLSEEYKDTQDSWKLKPQPLFSIAQLITFNIVLITLLALLVVFTFINKLLKKQKVINPLERKFGLRIISLIIVLFVAMLLTSATSLWFLYNTAFEEQKSHLVNTVQSRARIIESITRFDLKNREKLGLDVKSSHERTISQVIESNRNFRGFGQTGEFTFAQKKAGQIEFILQQSHSVTIKPKDIPWKSDQAEPMRRALLGQSGTLIGLDYRGVYVLAAHEPVNILNAGLVIKIDMEEIQKPYIRAGLIILSVTLGILSIGVMLFFILTVPMLKTLAQGYACLKEVVNHSPSLIMITDTKGESVFTSPKMDLLKKGAPTAGESRVLHRDGSTHTYLTSKFDLTIYDNLFGTCQISTDITNRVSAEIELKQLAMAFQSTNEGMMITDLTGRILKVNNAFEIITGYTSKEAIGSNSHLLQSGRHDKDFYHDMWTILTNKKAWSGEIWNRKKSGEIFPEWLNISTVYNSHQVPSYYIAAFSDITLQKKNQEQLYDLAFHDPLTKLPNRRLFQERMKHALLQAKRAQKIISLFIIDLDKFKDINDSLGHLVGDFALKEVSKRLQALVRKSDTVSRIGGDEFTIIAENFNNYRDVTIFANKLVQDMEFNLNIPEHHIMCSISLGVATYPQDGDSYEALLKNADAALYKAKELGRNNYQLYTADLTEDADERLSMAGQIQRGLEQGEFILYYQPQMDVKTGHLVSAEALVRWQHPELGLLSPDRFIPLAEDNGLIIPLGEWILKTACQQAKAWLDRGYDLKNIAVNLSVIQIIRPGLFETVKTVLEDTGLPAEKLELEITEGFIMSEVKKTIPLLESFGKQGITIAVDDFGTGYSSLSYLKRLPVTTLKIDRAFIKDLPNDEDVAISKAIIALGHSLGMLIVAEGVETQSQWDFLENEGCNLIQGFLKGKPVTAEKFKDEFLSKLKS